jgi:hypothetical protein
MRASPKVVGVGLTLAVIVSSFSPTTAAEPKDEVAAATTAWAQALGEDDPEKCFRSIPATQSLRDYFVAAFKALPGLKVTFGDQLIRVYGNTAVNTGYYTFSYVQNGESKIFPARYSFTYVKNCDRWMIVDHHSSAMPSPPK